ncbi:MFS transporter [Brevibacillus dissolubilis]|uniref:MFS transporter n=1 Tax=Brevibacillus dissolubilis TaxID=1844116 RepID=UPI00111710ED|nr:MFS transporter [Brevibacillus dissolubilis]
MSLPQEKQTAKGGDPGASKTTVAISGMYLFIYYAYGALTPLLSQYFIMMNLTGTQVGTITSITPVISILFQPIWGIICDRFQIRRPVLITTLLLAAAVSLLFTMVTSYAWILATFALLSLFQCAVTPISDSLALSFATKRGIQFGNLRLWGAVGFALAVFLTGQAIGIVGPFAVFYFYALAFVAAIFFIRRIPDEGASMNVNANIFRGLGRLIKLPRFLLFLCSSFFIFGAINANNTWFSYYYQGIGGTVAGVGLAFLLFAGSEAPFMRVASYFARRFGIELTILFAGAVSAARWIWYGTAPSTTIILVMFFIQGMSVGFYLATAAQFVRENTPNSLQVTALAIFSSVGHGLGTMFCNLMAGIIKDEAGILATYTFFGIASVLGLIPLLLIRFGPFKKERYLLDD